MYKLWMVGVKRQVSSDGLQIFASFSILYYYHPLLSVHKYIPLGYVRQLDSECGFCHPENHCHGEKRSSRRVFSNRTSMWSYTSQPTCQGEVYAVGLIEVLFINIQVAMYEHLASFLGGPPNEHHFSLYSKWAKFDWGMVVTGNVQVSSTHLSLGRDISLPDRISEDSLAPFKELASSMLGTVESKRTSLAIMQLSHAGRQSPNFIGGRYPFQRPSGPSPIPVKPTGQSVVSDLLHSFAFQTPHELSQEEIQDIIAAFVRGARVALKSGFDGVQLHAAHGCE